MIWLAPLIEHAQETGGKGGPEQKVFNYTQSIAIGLCERVDDFAAAADGAIGGLTRVWENGQLVYDIRPQQLANTALGLLAETDAEYAQRLTISAAYAETFTLYFGSEVQDPDPTMEAVEGMGNVPGMRGLAYIVYPNRQLQEGQGLRHPNFTFECYQLGTGDCTDATELSNDQIIPWNTGSSDPRAGGGQVYTYQFTRVDGGTPTPIRSTLEDAMGDAVDGGGSNTPFTLQPRLYGYSTCQNTIDFGSLEPWDTHAGFYTGGSVGITVNGRCNPPISAAHLAETFMFYNRLVPVGDLDFTIFDTALSAFSFCGWIQSKPTGRWWIGEIIQAGAGNHIPGHGIYSYPFAIDSGTFNCLEGNSVIVTYDDSITVKAVPGAPADPCFMLTPAPLSPFCIRADGKWVKGGSWTLDTSKLYKVLYSGGWGGATVESVWVSYLNPCLAPGDPNYSSSAFWTAEYNAAVASGDLPSGWTYGVQYPLTQMRAWMIDLEICEGSGASASLASIVLAICKRAGLSESQIDVSDLVSIFTDGYTISGICDAADIISPLRSIGFFDCVESGGKLKFPTRGKEIVATLTEDQFGCFDGDPFGESSQIPPKVAVTRQDETTLPRSIRLHYKATSRDYQDGEQDSPFRLSTAAVDDQDISIPVCIGDTQAVQSAEILWSDAWAAQNSYVISIDQALLELEGADCIGVPVDGFVTRMRIISESNASGVLRKLTLCGDDQGSYISFAESQPPQRQPQQLQMLSPSLAAFLNIPALSDADNNAGFYVVAWPDPAIGNTWRGAQLFQSVDGEVFTPSVFIPTAATIGTIDTAVPRTESFVFDEYTVITVNCDKSQSFTSRTDDAVLSGANGAVMGADGRWEVIQFANAEQITPTQWQLSRLLRGRRGTEYVMGSSIAGDQFIMVSTGDIVRVPLSVAQIGAQYVYKVVTNGSTLAEADEHDFVSRGQALVCFSPVDAVAHFNSGGDIEISWTRRDRLGETLMSGMDIPLSDYPLTFSIDIVQGQSPDSPAVIFRTLTTGTTSVVYAEADFLIDYAGESPASPQTIHVRIYQVSLTTGRGIPLIASLPVT